MTTDKEREDLRRLLQHHIVNGTGGYSDRLALAVLEDFDVLLAYSEAMAEAARDAYADSGFEDWVDKNSPATCLARLKAQWQAEGAAELIDRLPDGCDFGCRGDARQLRDEYLDQAEQPGEGS